MSARVLFGFAVLTLFSVIQLNHASAAEFVYCYATADQGGNLLPPGSCKSGGDESGLPHIYDKSQVDTLISGVRSSQRTSDSRITALEAKSKEFESKVNAQEAKMKASEDNIIKSVSSISQRVVDNEVMKRMKEDLKREILEELKRDGLLRTN